LSEEDKQRFFAAGYGTRQLLEIVLGLAQKTMSNYINHLADTPLDERFADFA
jgi:alkylhydroperoxidase family enzyme